MSGRDALLALAARCEAAEGPSIELDGEIAEAMLTAAPPAVLEGRAGVPIYIEMWRHPDGSIGSTLRYTASLDAALTLVPARTMWGAGVDEDGTGCADMPQHRLLVHARTPALALCAAALRALAEGWE